MEYAIAVIDIGMTNKKVAVYDDRLQALDAVYKTFVPLAITEPESGAVLEIQNLKEMGNWFIQEIKKFGRKYPIKAISISTHGATFVCIDKKGEVCAPCLLYTYEPGEAFHKSFYELCGAKDELQKSTYTPPFSSLINPAKGIFYLQTRFPDDFAKTACILNFPQYWAYVLTGITGMEPTYCGCHSYLWNHKKSTWSPVTDRLNIRRLLPNNYKNTYEVLGRLKPDMAKKLELEPDTIVTMGIHDSNASLLPYIAKNTGEDFILNSTGTWCVCMHPQDDLQFNTDDIGKIVFFNQSAFRQPVKTSIFLGGMEFDTYISLYKKINNTENFPSFSFEKTNALLAKKDSFLMPEAVPGSGQFTQSKAGIWENGKFYSLADIQQGKMVPAIIKDEQMFFALLDLSLVIQTETALRRSGLQRGTKVFTEGGFRKNKLYNALLAAILPENEIYITSITEATAFGAAMTAAMALSGKESSSLADSAKIEYTAIQPAPIRDYSEYKKAWLRLAENH